MNKERFAPITLESENYLIRSLDISDASESYKEWLNDEEVTQFIQVSGEGRLEDYIAGFDNDSRFLLGIFANKSKHIGNFTLVHHKAHKTVGMGLMIGDKSYWGVEAVQEARAVVLDFCFHTLDVYKVFGTCYSVNHAAVYNYKKQGWTLDGIRKGQFLFNGTRVDSINFSMFRDDWISE